MNFKYIFKIIKITDFKKFSNLVLFDIQTIMIQLLLKFSKSRHHYIYIDNFFTNFRFVYRLMFLNIVMIDTCKIKTKFSKSLLKLKKMITKKKN